jgi:hypothetical protein
MQRSLVHRCLVRGSRTLMFTCCLPSPRSKLGLYLVTRRNHGKRSTFLWYSLAAVLVFGASKLQMSENKGVNPLGLAFDWVYTPRP